MSEMTTIEPESDHLEMLHALRRGRFHGFGGTQALSQALQVPYTTLTSWLYGQRRPSWLNRQRIAALWDESRQNRA